MTDQVWLTITGIQILPDGEKQRSEMRMRAAYLEDGEVKILHYEDAQTAAACTLTVAGDRIVMERGEAGGAMSMIAGEETECEYQTPYGVIMMKIVTERVAVKESVRSIHARAHYRLKMEPDIEMQNVVTIRIEPIR